MRNAIEDWARLIFSIGCMVITILLCLALIEKAFEKPEKNEVEPPKLPKIDRESALELLEPGECMGDEIEERNFSFWICKNGGEG